LSTKTNEVIYCSNVKSLDQLSCLVQILKILLFSSYFRSVAWLLLYHDPTFIFAELLASTNELHIAPAWRPRKWNNSLTFLRHFAYIHNQGGLASILLLGER